MSRMDEFKKRIVEDDDFIYCPKMSNSLKELMGTSPENLKDDKIKRILLLDNTEQVEQIYQQAIQKLKKLLGT